MRSSLRRAAAIGFAILMTAPPASIALAVDPTPPPIVAGDDAYPATEDEPLNVNPEAGVLVNDPPGSCVLGTNTAGLIGSVAMNPDGSFMYTPPANYNGQTSFVYTITAGLCADKVPGSEATVTLTVAPVNDPPTAAPDSFGVIKDHTLNVNAPGVLLNDHDVDGDSLTALKVTNAAHGVVILAADGSFSYTPASGYTGPDAFSYQASDGTATSPTRVVTLTVTAVPPVPTPTPVPTPVPTAVPSPSPEVTPEPSPTAEPTEAAAPSAPAVATIPPTVAPAVTPAPTAVPGSVADDGGGISLPVLLVLVLLVLLIGFGAALYGPRWLAAQRGEPIDDDIA